MTDPHPGRSATAVRPPTTRDEVDAHRYALRRLESALVRADPIPLDEQLRSQRRATMIGALLGALGLVAAAVLAAVAPKPLWQNESLVVGQASGAVYAVVHDPEDMLVPVTDAVVGRLVLAASGGAAPEAQVRIVPDELLAKAPRTQPVELPGVVAVQPSSPPIPERWAVCDEIVRGRPVRTTVLAGTYVPPPADNPPASPLLYLTSPGTGPFIVVDGRRHALESRHTEDNDIVLDALGLAGRQPVTVSDHLVTAIPAGVPLQVPVMPKDGPGPMNVQGRTGDVLVTTAVDGSPRYYAIVPGAIQEIPSTLAEVLRVAGSRDPIPTQRWDLTGVPQEQQINVTGWPGAVPSWTDPAGQVCWTWVEGRPGASVTPALPAAQRAANVSLANAHASAVVVAAGGPVRAWSPTGGGAIWLVSAAGVGYGVAEQDTAAALGIPPDLTSAPAAALDLLSQGSRLDLADVRRALPPALRSTAAG